MGVFFNVPFVLTVDDKFGCIDRLLAGLKVVACEQEFWLGISRFRRGILNQSVCLAGPQKNVAVTVTLFDTRGQLITLRKRRSAFGVYCSIMVPDKFSPVIDERRKNTLDLIWGLLFDVKDICYNLATVM